jgi:hypothetical protein
MAGRKSKFEELQIVERYAELSEPFFKVLKKMLNSKVKGDQRFAIEQLSKAFPKMIPTQITGAGGDPIQVAWLSQSPTIQENGPKVSITA